MSGLRETKKVLTRQALARAAAEIALTEGIEKLTIPAIAESAGVSTRTFHNYFNSREDALLEFFSEQIAELAGRRPELPPDASLLDVVETIVINGIRENRDGLSSFAALARLGQLMETTVPLRTARGIGHRVFPVIADLISSGDQDPFEAALTIEIAATAARVALEQHYLHGEVTDTEAAVESVQKAFRLVRSLGS